MAPDLRGFGGSEAPEAVKDYDVLHLASDMLKLLSVVLKKPCYALVGHDWGAILAWHLGCLHPEAFPRLCIMSVPPVTLLARTPPLTRMAEQWLVIILRKNIEHKRTRRRVTRKLERTMHDANGKACRKVGSTSVYSCDGRIASADGTLCRQRPPPGFKRAPARSNKFTPFLLYI